MFHVKIQILFTFRKTYKYNHYKNVSGNSTTVDVVARGHLLVISDSVLVVSMSKYFGAWTTLLQSVG